MDADARIAFLENKVNELEEELNEMCADLHLTTLQNTEAVWKSGGNRLGNPSGKKGRSRCDSNLEEKVGARQDVAHNWNVI
jgi:hypothetical protein